MANISFPSFMELYKTFQETVQTESGGELTDFSQGSRLDAYAGVAAAAAQSVMMVINSALASFFLSTAAGTDLDKLIAEQYHGAPWLSRRSKESDPELRDRVLEYEKKAMPGTIQGIEYCLHNIADNLVEDTTLFEDFPKGRVVVDGKWKEGRGIADMLLLKSILDKWRPAGIIVELRINAT